MANAGCVCRGDCGLQLPDNYHTNQDCGVQRYMTFEQVNLHLFHGTSEPGW